MRNLCRLVAGLLLAASLSAPLSAQVSINTNLTTGTMTTGVANLYRTAYLHFQLVNCGDNIPVMPGQSNAVVQDSFDLRPATPGSAIVGEIIGNDQITCGNVISTYYQVTPMKDASHPLRDGIPYVICSASATITTCGNAASLGTFNLITADPQSQPPPVPGFVQTYGNPTNSQTINQPVNGLNGWSGASTSFTITNGLTLGTITTAQLTALTGYANFVYLADGTSGSNPCTGGGTGAFAFYVAGVWNCSIGGGGGGGGTITAVNPSAPLTGGGSSGAVALGIAAGGVTNSLLANPSVTVNGTTCTLGSTCAPTAAPATPLGSLQGNNGGVTAGVPNTVANFTTGATNTGILNNVIHSAYYTSDTLPQLLARCVAGPTTCYVILDNPGTQIQVQNTPAIIGSATQSVIVEDHGQVIVCAGTVGADCIDIAQWGALVAFANGPGAGGGNGNVIFTTNNAVITSQVTNYDKTGGQNNFQFKGFNVVQAVGVQITSGQAVWEVAIEGKGATRDMGIGCGSMYPGSFALTLADGPATGDVNALVFDNDELFASNAPCVPLNIISTTTGNGEGSNYAFVGSSLVDSSGTVANTTTSAAITTTGAQSVTVPSTTGIYLNGYVTITGSDSHTERVFVTAVVTNTSFTANFGLTHVNGSAVTSVGPCLNGDYCLENVDGTSGTDGVVANTTTTAVISAPGLQYVTTAATTGIFLGVPVNITGSDSHAENVTPTCVATSLCASGFTANFTLTHVNSSAVTTQGNHYVSGIGQLCPYYETHTGMTGEYSEIRNVRGYFNVCFALNGGPALATGFDISHSANPFMGPVFLMGTVIGSRVSGNNVVNHITGYSSGTGNHIDYEYPGDGTTKVVDGPENVTGNQTVGGTLTVIGGCTGCGGGTSPPGWLAYFGGGTAGAVTITTTQNLAPVKWYTTFTCSGTPTIGATAPNQPVIIRATISITIGAGCIFSVAGNTSTFGDMGASGAGGGGGTAGGVAGNATKGISAGSYQALLNGGAAGASTGGTGGNGNSVGGGLEDSFIDMGAIEPEQNLVCGSVGGAGGSTGGAAGNGGGCIILIAPTITLASGATFNANGTAGGNSTGNNIGAGGGGGGGVVIIRSPNLTDNGAVFNVSGGAGGSCLAFTGCGVGGTGGAGWSVEITQ